MSPSPDPMRCWIAGVAALASMEWWWGLVVGIPLVYFFLFCNVFRVSRPLELLWAGVFVVLAGTTLVTGVPGWLPTSIVSVLVAALVVGAEMRKPSYHGVGWQSINPALPTWWGRRSPQAAILHDS